VLEERSLHPRTRKSQEGASNVEAMIFVDGSYCSF
jgi:hypothetical protein